MTAIRGHTRHVLQVAKERVTRGAKRNEIIGRQLFSTTTAALLRQTVLEIIYVGEYRVVQGNVSSDD
jgi:hypothetical protein